MNPDENHKRVIARYLGDGPHQRQNPAAPSGADTELLWWHVAIKRPTRCTKGLARSATQARTRDTLLSRPRGAR